MSKYLVLLSCILLFSASRCGEEIKTSDCSTIGTVKDYTGLDGCQFLIVLENGEKLQPVNEGKSQVEWKDGQRIRFDYEEDNEHMSICMAGKMVEVTCYELLGKVEPTVPPGTGGIKPVKIPCIETLDPYKKDWMTMAMEKTKAYQVIRYRYRTDGWAYYFLGPKKSVMFDCQGTLICECGAKETKCDDQAKNYTEELVIWEKD